MQRVYTIALSCKEDNGSITDSITRLCALRHKMSRYTRREYTFGDGLTAQVIGMHKPISAWHVHQVRPGNAEMIVEDRKTFPTPYIDWTQVTDTKTEPTIDVFITDKLSIRVCGDVGHETVRAEMIEVPDKQRHMDALDAVCGVSGFGCVSPSVRKAIGV